MTGAGAIVRLLMLGTCLVPFTSTRQAALFVSAPPVSSAPTTPAPPPSEEEETERGQEVTAKEKARRSAALASRPPAASARPLHANPVALPSKSPTRSPSPIDPFRNGLGCPFRC
jgi:hypothetical protein